MAKYRIIGTGSKGNSVLIDNILVDCGVSYKRISRYLKDVKYLLLTHIHSDHINEQTLNKIRENYPLIKIIGNEEVDSVFGVNIVSEPLKTIFFKEYKITPFYAVHDVICHGYTWEHNNENVIYCTDTETLDYAPVEVKFDYFFLESNQEVNSYRHLTYNQARDFYHENRRSVSSVFVGLHQSRNFF